MLILISPMSFRGSSPQVRGTRCHHGCRYGQQRFIPAGAGNTGRATTWSRSDLVHPRTRGEHGLPRQLAKNHGRFIPAGAGNTSRVGPCDPAATVHPRICGEHDAYRHTVHGASGSSPRMRGTPLRKLSGCYATRFIPAYAGNT